MSDKLVKASEKAPAVSVDQPKQGDHANDLPDEWEVAGAADTLMKAEKIKKDKRLMPHVHKHLKKTAKAIHKITSTDDVRQAYKDKFEDPDHDND